MGLFDRLKQLSDVADQIKDSVAATGILPSQDSAKKPGNTTSINGTIKGLEASLKVSDEMNQELTRQLEQAQAQIQKLESRKSRNLDSADPEKIKSLQNTITELSNKVHKLEAEIATLKTEKKDALKKLEKCREELAAAGGNQNTEVDFKDYIRREDYEMTVMVNQKLQKAMQKQVEALEHQVKIRNSKLRELRSKYFIDPEDLEDINF